MLNWVKDDEWSREKKMKTSNLIDYTVVGAVTPIVFLNGMALDKRSTSLFFEPFMRSSNWQRVYLDLPGMGQSAPTTAASSEAVLRALIEAIHEIIGDQPFAVYGHSYGGYLAQARAGGWSFSNRAGGDGG